MAGVSRSTHRVVSWRLRAFTRCSALSKSHESRLQDVYPCTIRKKPTTKQLRARERFMATCSSRVRSWLLPLTVRYNALVAPNAKQIFIDGIFAHTFEYLNFIWNLNEFPPNDKRIIQPFRKLLIRTREPLPAKELNANKHRNGTGQILN